VRRKTSAPYAAPPAGGLIASSLGETHSARASIRPVVERRIAVGYGLAYDAIVRGFPPYEELVEEVAALVGRGAKSGPPVATQVLDVACGTGTVAARLARRGWTLVGVDAVAHLIGVARRRHRTGGLSLSFHHADLAHDPVPPPGSFDVLVSMHTLYWHPDPEALLLACRLALRPGGHALFLTYERPARVLRTFRDVRAERGWLAAVRGLRWLLPTAIFDMFRGVRPRYLSREQLDACLQDAGFEVLERRRTFLGGISLLAWTRTSPSDPSPRR
jgi:2-polyprenyl-3-methyl-5-hydroxy-6-metoxy-1,4-benzoquinol methylase